MRSFLSTSMALFVLISSLISCTEASRNPDVAPYGTYAEGLIGSVKADGWIEEFLNRQLSGMTGHREALDYPYNTMMWMGESTRMGDWGCDWWRFEQTGYFTDGAMRLGYLNGKKPGLPDFKCWNITPTAPWNYAIVHGAEPEYMKTGADGYPLDPGNAPCIIRIPVRKVTGWVLDEDRYTSRVPYEFELECDVEHLELVPYGSTTIRLTLFPWN